MANLAIPAGGQAPAQSAGNSNVIYAKNMAADVVALWKKYFAMCGRTDIEIKTDDTPVPVGAVDLSDGLSKTELSQLSITMANPQLYHLIDTNMNTDASVTDANSADNIDDEEITAFFNNIVEYGKLLGFAMNSDVDIQTVADMYNQAGVQFKTVSAEDKAEIHTAATALAGATSAGQPAATQKATWDIDKSLANTRALACSVLGADTPPAEKKALVEALVNAYWTNVLGKTNDTEKMTDDELNRLWSFLSFWRNAPDSTLQGWIPGQFAKVQTEPLTKTTGDICVMDAGNYEAVFKALVPPPPDPGQQAQGTPQTLPPAVQTAALTDTEAAAVSTFLGIGPLTTEQKNGNAAFFQWLATKNADVIAAVKAKLGEMTELVKLVPAGTTPTTPDDQAKLIARAIVMKYCIGGNFSIPETDIPSDIMALTKAIKFRDALDPTLPTFMDDLIQASKK